MMSLFVVTLNSIRDIIMNTTTDTDSFSTEFHRPLESSCTRATEILLSAYENPEALFKSLMGTLVAVGITAKAWPHIKSSNWMGTKSSDKCGETGKTKPKPPEVFRLQARYLPVFYLFRMSFWMSGPYFYQAYSSKMLRHLDGTTSPASPAFVARVSLVGYLAIVLLGPMVGKAIDRYGRKTATVCTGAMYALGSLTVFSEIPIVLYIGRAVASIASSRLTATPESWLIQEYLRIRRKDGEKETKDSGLSEIFGLAYGGDAIVAILAGQTASLAASKVDHPTGPFLVSPLFVTVALLLTIFFWVENKEIQQESDNKKRDAKEYQQTTSGSTMREGAKLIFSDPKILMVGLVQSLFEGSMYIFVLVWPPILSNSIQSSYGATAGTPFGTIFSCFMACCLLGSVHFRELRQKSVDVKRIMIGILLVSTFVFSWSVFALYRGCLFGIVASFFAFEACVGTYFPSIGTIRSEILPEDHRCAIMTLFAIPLNILVVGVISFQPMLGNSGSLTIASLAMGIAWLCMTVLERIIRKEEEDKLAEKAAENWGRKRVVLKRSSDSEIPRLKRMSSFERLSICADNTVRRRQSSCYAGALS